jgi:hypothetical protein
MKHKIEFIGFECRDDYGARLIIDGEPLFYDAEYTFTCLEEILNKLNVDYEIEYYQEKEEIFFVTKKMKLVEDEDK